VPSRYPDSVNSLPNPIKVVAKNRSNGGTTAGGVMDGYASDPLANTGLIGEPDLHLPAERFRRQRRL
jgi:hypothetical protein